MLTQVVNNFTRKQLEEGIDKGYKILPLGKIQSNHFKVSFNGDSPFLRKHNEEHVQSQYKIREFVFLQKKTNQTNPHATYSSLLTSLGHARREGGYELVAQKRGIGAMCIPHSKLYRDLNHTIQMTPCLKWAELLSSPKLSTYIRLRSPLKRVYAILH